MQEELRSYKRKNKKAASSSRRCCSFLTKTNSCINYSPILLKPKKQLDCSCEKDEKIPFTQSKMFLGIITLFAVVMLAFPYYSGIFYPTTEKQIIIVDQSNIREIEFTISGMTCASCGEHVNSEVNKLTGIISSDASYENKNAVVKFDDSKTNIDEIENAINATGYLVTDKKEY